MDIMSLYRGRRVLVTGHTGFKGAWLSFWLQRLGAEVLGLALGPPTAQSLFEEAQLGELVDSRRGDVRDPEALRAAVADFRPEAIFHLAAQSLVRPSYDDPLGTLSTNVMGTANVLQTVRHSPETRAVVIVTTDKCYRNDEWPWGYRESDPLGGHDPYSASKACAELVAAAYRDSFFPPAKYARAHSVAVATARSGNVIGGGDWAVDRLVPDCVRSFMAGQPAKVRLPRAVRPWQHVLEPLWGYILLGAKLTEEGPAFGGPWNFAPLDRGDMWTVGQMATRLRDLWGQGATWLAEEEPQPPEAGLLVLDASKAFMRLGWRPRWTTDEALAKTVAWYRGWQEDGSVRNVRALMASQIDEYMGAKDV